MKINKSIFFLLLFYSSFVLGQDRLSGTLEFGVSLASITQEKSPSSVRSNYDRYGSSALLNGFIIKYHRRKVGSYRLRLRSIAPQSTRNMPNFFPDVYLDNPGVGIELGLGYEVLILNNKYWRWYTGAELGIYNLKRESYFIKIDKTRSSDYGYTSYSINPILGIRLRASKHLSFSIESNGTLGFYKSKDGHGVIKKTTRAHNYWNTLSIFAATITIPSKLF